MSEGEWNRKWKKKKKMMRVLGGEEGASSEVGEVAKSVRLLEEGILRTMTSTKPERSRPRYEPVGSRVRNERPG